MPKTYLVEFLSAEGAATTRTVQCETVHVDARGTKFLNGRGANAELVMFLPTERIISINKTEG